jgi:putative nucleotidyltransferase with HDIG domain
MQHALTNLRTRMKAEVERIVITRVAAGDFEIPQMSAVATRCLEVLRDPDFARPTLIAELEHEPALVALALRASNSAVHGGARITRIDQAVARLGVQQLRTIILEYASSQLFRSKDPQIREANHKVWEHSLAVARGCRELAVLLRLDRDACYLTGLLHDIGKPVVAAILDGIESRTMVDDGASWLDFDLWRRTVGVAHDRAGDALADAWKLPIETTQGMQACTCYDASRPRASGNLVRFANALAKREGFFFGYLDLEELETAIAEGVVLLGLDGEGLARIVAAIADRGPAS